MTLAAGTRLAGYEIVALLGAGGMGEVYRARDTRLGRDVAIKVIPEEFARDKARLERFGREAQLLAQLNHANIATLHGLEEHDGQPFLVMELVEGETLAERIARGPLPLDEVEPLFIQIAEGLEAAHEKGIIHRDLKPANVKIGTDGKPKILDFGLAKAFAPEQGVSAETSQSPTLTKGTALGVIVGTASYMSPEQARGKVVDKRTDIWAFGCCLYEALTAKKAFGGDTVTDILAAVVHKEPDLSTMPSGVANLIRRCLTKDARERLRDIGEARISLAHRDRDLPQSRSRPPRVLLVALALGAVLLGGFVATVLLRSTERAEKRGVTRVELESASSRNLSNAGVGRFMAISPDGHQIAFTAAESNTTRLYLRGLDSLEPTVIRGTEGAANPFFSPDGRWIGFFAGGELKKVRIGGGEPLRICSVPSDARGGAWGADNTVVFGAAAGGLSRVDAAGGEPEVLTRLDSKAGETAHRWPSFLPNARGLLFTVLRDRNFHVEALSLPSGRRVRLAENATAPQYVPSGHLVYAHIELRDSLAGPTVNSLIAVPFHEDTLTLAGEPEPVLEQVLVWPGGAAHYDVSTNGTLVYASGRSSPLDGQLVWVDHSGAREVLTESPRAFFNPRISPDGNRIAVTVLDAARDLWVYDLGRDSVVRETFSGQVDSAAWASKPDRLLYILTNEPAVMAVAADGSSRPELVAAIPPRSFHLTASRQGGEVAFVVDDSGNPNIWRFRYHSSVASPKPERLSMSTAFDTHPEISPDGRWIAYVSAETGRQEVYVRSLSHPGQRQISTNGGTEPAWSPDGRELFFRENDRIDVVTVDTSQGFSVSAPKVVVDGGLLINDYGRNYDVSPDGRLLIVQSVTKTSPTRLEMTFDWFQELERLAPASH